MKRLIAILTSVALWAATLPVVGCTVTAQQIQEEGATVGNMLISMANVVQDPASAAKLQKIGQGLIAATANFQLGSPTAIINDSINAAEVVLASIPKTQAIALLLPIAEAAIDILIANLNKTTGKMGPVTRQIQQAYQEQLGKEVAPSTVYRLLDRHGWRKVVPRPRHPKADIAAQAAFKKTAPHGTPRGRAPG